MHVKICGHQIILPLKAKKGQKGQNSYRKFLWIWAENKAVHVKICGQKGQKGQKGQNSYRMFLWIGAENKAVHVKICGHQIIFVFKAINKVICY